jgi:hypothetical protein
MRAFAGKSDWLPIAEAPYGEDLELFVTDLYDSFYGLRYPCRRTAEGWVSSSHGTPLAVTPVLWRRYRPPCHGHRVHDQPDDGAGD